MKKIFLLAFGVFTFSLFVNFGENNMSTIKIALADEEGGTCCPEYNSWCTYTYDGITVSYSRKYYKKGPGRCSSKPTVTIGD